MRSNTHRIHVWYIYMVTFNINIPQMLAYHTWILWDISLLFSTNLRCLHETISSHEATRPKCTKCFRVKSSAVSLFFPLVQLKTFGVVKSVAKDTFTSSTSTAHENQPSCRSCEVQHLMLMFLFGVHM